MYTCISNSVTFDISWLVEDQVIDVWHWGHKLGTPGPRFNIQYKTILRPSYLHNGIFYTGKMTFLYWIRAQVYLEEIMVPKGVLVHRFVDSMEDNAVAAAIDMAWSVLESTEVSDQLM